MGRWLTSAFVLLGSVVFPAALEVQSACAAGGPRAALVVDTGGSVQAFCVALPDEEVSGLQLIALANEQHGLAYKLGFGGEAVCMLAGVGPTSDDCFEQYPDFWGYWRGDGNGGWIWSGTGAGSATVEDGDVEGWAWGSGSNGDSHPRPPATKFGSICAQQADPQPPASKPGPRQRDRDDSPPPRPKPRTGSRPPTAVGPDAASSPRTREPAEKSAEDRARGPKRKKERDADKFARPADSTVATRPSASPSPGAQQATSALGPEGSSGPPPAGLVALTVAVLLGGAGVVLARRRRSSGS